MVCLFNWIYLVNMTISYCDIPFIDYTALYTNYIRCDGLVQDDGKIFVWFQHY